MSFTASLENIDENMNFNNGESVEYPFLNSNIAPGNKVLVDNGFQTSSKIQDNNKTLFNSQNIDFSPETNHFSLPSYNQGQGISEYRHLKQANGDHIHVTNPYERVQFGSYPFNNGGVAFDSPQSFSPFGMDQSFNHRTLAHQRYEYTGIPYRNFFPDQSFATPDGQYVNSDVNAPFGISAPVNFENVYVSSVPTGDFSNPLHPPLKDYASDVNSFLPQSHQNNFQSPITTSGSKILHDQSLGEVSATGSLYQDGNGGPETDEEQSEVESLATNLESVTKMGKNTIKLGKTPAKRRSGRLTALGSIKKTHASGGFVNADNIGKQAKKSAAKRGVSAGNPELLPSRDSGYVLEGHVGVTNKPLQMVPQEEISDASLIKRGLTRTGGAVMSRRAHGANDPENIQIVNMVENMGWKWVQIANELNRQRVATGRKPSFTPNSCHNRYNRNAPLLFAAEGKTFVPVKDRHGPQKLSAVWTPELDTILVTITKEVEAEKWTQVAQRFSKETGMEIDAIAAAYRHQLV